MKRPLFSDPDPFSLSPLLALLPVRGRVGDLAGMTASLFARFEKVNALVHEAGEVGGVGRIRAEQNMLRQVLEWLAVKPE